MAATAARDLSSVSSVIQLKGVNKWFGQFHVLTDINLDVKEGEKIVICGPSGSGKSTLIRCINRLEEHQRGDIVVHGVTLETEQLLATHYAEQGGELTRIGVETATPIGSFTGWSPARHVTQWAWTKPA